MPPRARARRDARPFALDPRFERERRGAEAGRLAERDVRVRPAEVDGIARGQCRIRHAGRHDGQGVRSRGFAVAGREREHVGADCREADSRGQRRGTAEYHDARPAGLAPLHGTDGRTVGVDDGAGEARGRGQRHRLIGAGKNHGRHIDRRGAQRAVTAGRPAPARPLQRSPNAAGAPGRIRRRGRSSSLKLQRPGARAPWRSSRFAVADDLRGAARVVPDARFVERPGKEPGRRARRGQRRAERRVLNAVGARRLPDDHGAPSGTPFRYNCSVVPS